MIEPARGPSRILVIGAGGREHAIAWSLARERGVESVLVAPGSDGIATEPGVRCLSGVAATDGRAIVRAALENRVDLVVIGPESPLAAGVADVLVDAGIPTFGPSSAAARIETSKAFCREVADAAGVRVARGAAFDDADAARAYAVELATARGSRGVVIKADGLAAGKGVTVCDDATAAATAIRALAAAREAQSGRTGEPPHHASTPGTRRPLVVVEERLEGPEASLIALCDGHFALAMTPARDHKRLSDGDEGPNTGGMGAYTPVPDLPSGVAAALVQSIHVPILAELARRGRPFRGALYAGLILTSAGPVLLECNARFGDPETQALLPRLALPLGPLLLAAARGELAAAAAEIGVHGLMLPMSGDAAVAIVLASAGYPESPTTGARIAGLEAAAASGAVVFHAGTARDPDGSFRTSGGRVLSVVGLGSDLAAARARAERAADLVTFEGLQRRHDIAARVPPSSGAGAEGSPPVPAAPRSSARSAADRPAPAPAPADGTPSRATRARP